MPTDLSLLSTLADRINREHEACEAAVKAGLLHAIEAGRLLLEAKTTIGHGGWLPWVRANCRVSERTAQAYMRVARKVGELEAGNPQRVADLSLREALSLLASPATAELPAPMPDNDDDSDSRDWGPLSPEEQILLAECEAVLETARQNLINWGQAGLVIRAKLTPEQFSIWLRSEAGNEDHQAALLRVMNLLTSDPDPKFGPIDLAYSGYDLMAD